MADPDEREPGARPKVLGMGTASSASGEARWRSVDAARAIDRAWLRADRPAGSRCTTAVSVDSGGLNRCASRSATCSARASCGTRLIRFAAFQAGVRPGPRDPRGQHGPARHDQPAQRHHQPCLAAGQPAAGNLWVWAVRVGHGPGEAGGG